MKTIEITKNFSLHFGPVNLAGLIAISYGMWTVHILLPRRGHWHWGHDHEDYDDICEYYGLGPLFLVVKENY